MYGLRFRFKVRKSPLLRLFALGPVLPSAGGTPSTCGSSRSTTWGLRTFLPLAAILAVKEALVDFEVGATRYEDLETHPTPGYEELLVLEPFFGDYCEIWILHDDGPPAGGMPYQKWCRVYPCLLPVWALAGCGHAARRQGGWCELDFGRSSWSSSGW